MLDMSIIGILRRMAVADKLLKNREVVGAVSLAGVIVLTGDRAVYRGFKYPNHLL